MTVECRGGAEVVSKTPAVGEGEISPPKYRSRITGMDCANDAAEIEAATRSIAGVEHVRVSVASQIMTLRMSNAGAPPDEIHTAVRALGYRLKEIEELAKGGGRAPTPRSPRAGLQARPVDRGAPQRGVRPRRDSRWLPRRIPGAEGRCARFLGDGLITFLGLVALAWSLAWRARATLLQGVFLGALGVGVLAMSLYRMVAQQVPEAELMGVFGLIAVAVNVAAAVVLIPHRTGDANVRAVWLFSRNDALGNAAVVVAAVLVKWTNSPWPDLVVALFIATLFLRSSWSIVRDARADLAAAGS